MKTILRITVLACSIGQLPLQAMDGKPVGRFHHKGLNTTTTYSAWPQGRLAQLQSIKRFSGIKAGLGITGALITMPTTMLIVMASGALAGLNGDYSKSSASTTLLGGGITVAATGAFGLRHAHRFYNARSLIKTYRPNNPYLSQLSLNNTLKPNDRLTSPSLEWFYERTTPRKPTDITF